MTRRPLLVALAFALAFGPSSMATAQNYPTKPITLIVPYSPGGGTDLTVRMVEEAASRRLGQKIKIVNKPGAAGTVGHRQLTQAAPDGYTIAVVGVGSTAMRPHTTDVGYGPGDYFPILQLNTVPFLLVAPGNSEFKGLKDVFDAARKSPPGKLKVGITSRGSWLHLSMLRLEKMGGVKFTYIPHGSSGEVVTSVMGGHLDLGNADIPSAGPKVVSGDVRALGVFTARRQSDLPDVPTLKEQGTDLGGFYYNMLIAPKGTPDGVIQKLHDAFKGALEDPDVGRRAAQAGIRLEYLGPADSQARINDFYETAGVLLRELGATKK
jgi:tripartite-type tricarboxylate transporter receptor subunit TctC